MNQCLQGHITDELMPRKDLGKWYPAQVKENAKNFCLSYS